MLKGFAGAIVFESVNNNAIRELQKTYCNKTGDDVESSSDTIKNYLLLSVKKGLIFYEE